MRTFVLLLLLTIPPFAACGVAYAKTSTEIGKPVCTHYDDATRSERTATSPGVAPANVSTVTSVAIATAAPPIVSAGSAATRQKSGGTSGMMRPHDAPRWQTFLPGMFK